MLNKTNYRSIKPATQTYCRYFFNLYPFFHPFYHKNVDSHHFYKHDPFTEQTRFFLLTFSLKRWLHMRKSPNYSEWAKISKTEHQFRKTCSTVSKHPPFVLHLATRWNWRKRAPPPLLSRCIRSVPNVGRCVQTRIGNCPQRRPSKCVYMTWIYIYIYKCK